MCTVLDRGSSRVLWLIGTSHSAWIWTQETRKAGSGGECRAPTLGAGVQGVQRFPKAAPAAPHWLGKGWGCVCSLLGGEVSLHKVRSKQQTSLQKNAVSHILHQLIFFWRANHCSFEKGTKEISLTIFSASLQYSVHQMCPVYQKIQMLQLSFGIT